MRAVQCLWVTVPQREVSMRNPQRPMWKHGKEDFTFFKFYDQEMCFQYICSRNQKLSTPGYKVEKSS